GPGKLLLPLILPPTLPPARHAPAPGRLWTSLDITRAAPARFAGAALSSACSATACADDGRGFSRGCPWWWRPASHPDAGSRTTRHGAHQRDAGAPSRGSGHATGRSAADLSAHRPSRWR